MSPLESLADRLRCPHCGQPLRFDQTRIVCPAMHAFDVARQGYVNLHAGPPPGHADTAAMVSDRADFLAGGHFDRIIDAVPLPPAPELIIDLGAGPGRQLARWLDRRPQAYGIAIDVSVPACRRAARAHARATAVVADVWRELPIVTAAADLVTVVFAPRNFTEIGRVLRPDGRLVVVTPQSDHLRQLRDRFGLLDIPADKQATLAVTSARWFDIATSTAIRYDLELAGADIARVVAMGPNAHHLDRDDLADRTRRSTTTTVTVSCTITELVRTDRPGS